MVVRYQHILAALDSTAYRVDLVGEVVNESIGNNGRIVSAIRKKVCTSTAKKMTSNAEHRTVIVRRRLDLIAV